MPTRSISSTEAQNNFGRILDEVVRNDTRYIIRRRNTAEAILISLSEFERILSDDGEQAKLEHIIREISPSYNLGDDIEHQ